MSTMPLADIRLRDRARKDMGDLEGLAESMKTHGLLHPVVILSDKTLVAGGRRLAAAALLGWEEVPVTVVEVADLLSAEKVIVDAYSKGRRTGKIQDWWA